ncbi:MAG TPA: hypothetical protein VIV11_39450 [Kofleriaceae bacterium]
MSIAALFVVSTGTAVADRHAENSKVRSELVAAINKRDVTVVSSRVVLPLKVRSLRFAASTCEKFGATEVTVDESDLPAFVACLADLDLKALIGPDDKWINALYGPGFPLIFSHGGPDGSIDRIYGYAKPGSDLFVIEPVVFTSHIKKFTREIAPSQATKKALAAAATEHVAARVHVCVDARGKVDALAKVADESLASYEEDVTKAVRKWSIKPFMFGGKKIHACATLTLGYPADRIETSLQMQPPTIEQRERERTDSSVPMNVAPTLLEDYRISGEKLIVPDDATKTAFADSGRDRLIASFKLCIGDKGTVSTVSMLKTGGFPAYDEKIMRQMKTWTYRPYQVNGKAVPVCTAVTFIYSQK